MWLRVIAPFAAFRPLTAGSFRPTAPFIPPSTAYGLLLNLAGIETRLDDRRSPMTVMREDLPTVELAVGAVSECKVQSIFQQLHNYPVGQTGKKRAPDCKGAKYNIQPIRREFISEFDGCIGLRGNDEIADQIRATLREGNARLSDGRLRYGIPFLGDNSFMIDVLREESSPPAARWYRRLGPGDEVEFGEVCRLSIWIDRADMTRTRLGLFAPSERSDRPPETAWIRVGPEPAAAQPRRDRTRTRQ